MITMDGKAKQKRQQLLEEQKKKNEQKQQNNLDMQDLMAVPPGNEGNFYAEEEGEFEDPEVTYTQKKVKERLGKYKQDMVKDMVKNPSEYTITTPEGQMTLEEAVKRGYNPKTGQFDLEPIEKPSEDKISELSKSDQEAYYRLFSPKNAQIPPAEADLYGLPQDSPLLRQVAHAGQGAENPILAALGGGTAPTNEPSGNNLSAIQHLLGGV